ncbi:hypothetical protein [Streptomyces sp. NPDC058412]|uniref:hypothetical protein n=1 Tax=Streptomyces sp. NPDC058412 TaxID=3346486 RepID=UPI00365AEFD9
MPRTRDGQDNSTQARPAVGLPCSDTRTSPSTASGPAPGTGGAKVSDPTMLAMALHLRDAEKLSLRDIAHRLVITRGKKKGQHPSPATVLRMLRDHDEQLAADAEMQTQPTTP